MAVEDPGAEALAAARAGGGGGWEWIYRDLQSRLIAYLRARGAPEPEDLLGEVFLQAVRDFSRFKGNYPEFKAWIFSIARHRLLDDVRARARRKVDPLPPDRLQAIGPSGDSQSEAIETIASDEVRRAIERLSPDQRDVLLMRILGDMKIHEIAKALGKRQGAVQALQRRGLEALKREISSGSVAF